MTFLTQVKITIHKWLIKTSIFLVWLNERNILCAIVVVGIALFFVYFKDFDEPSFRWTGGVLQLLGVFTVAVEIYKTRVEFGHLQFGKFLRDWYARCPLSKKPSIGDINGRLPPLEVHIKVDVFEVAKKEATTEERIEVLEKNAKFLNLKINKTQSTMDQEFKTHGKALKDEEQARKAHGLEILHKLEIAETGGLHITFMGVVWLFVGGVMSTFAHEFATPIAVEH